MLFGELVYSNYLLLGYPSCLNSECEVTYEQSFGHLVEQVENGADFIITQMLFDAKDFFRFVTACRAENITIPIIPGILPIQVSSDKKVKYILRLASWTPIMKVKFTKVYLIYKNFRSVFLSRFKFDEILAVSSPRV